MVNDKKPGAKGPAPTASETVDAFFAALDHPLKDVMVLIRGIILGSQTGVTEHIKWNAPSFCHNGDDRITFNLHKPDQVLLVFHRGAKAKTMAGDGRLIDDTSGLLAWAANDRATVKFATLGEAKEAQATLRDVVRAWLKAAAD